MPTQDDFTDALIVAQTLLENQRSNLEAPLTRANIASQVEIVLNLNPRWKLQVDGQSLCRELEKRFNILIEQESKLVDNKDHRDWLAADRKQNWRYWERYRQHMARRLAPASLDALNRVTDTVLGLLEDPQREGPWDRRGLVVGHVQSGKTGNYAGLICKAADAGYKVIIVLAGLHNNLRSQTQMRLDEGFLGYETMPPGTSGGRPPIGVGLVDPSPRPNYVTNRSDGGDFSRSVANNMGINPGGDPLLFVVKKNAKVLRNLIEWINWAAKGRAGGTGKPIVQDVPLLVIDDEADHASVDTKDQAFDENGNPDPDHDPSAINRYIRQLLQKFEKSAYVGYTATPFANIFIHDRGATVEEGEDLFPRSFIVNLPAPSNHVGPVRVFGMDDGSGNIDPLPLTRTIIDHADSLNPDEQNGWMPPRHRNGHMPLWNGVREVPPSLRQALRCFILVCAARRARGQKRQHNSMLVHVTRFTSVQREVYSQVENELLEMRQRLLLGEGSGQGSLVAELCELWERDFFPTSLAVSEAVVDPDLQLISWDAVRAELQAVAHDIEIKEINGSAGDILQYEERKETGLNVIAIGGDKLSRGLTLEGLSISYFLRASRMYDTLMQMGRWFGYRPGYVDLCRLYTTPDLVDWFQHITEASEELRREFDHMDAIGGTPKDYGLRVRSHPVLMVTSKVKMRHGTELQLSFDSDTPETVVFDRSRAVIEGNFRAAENLIAGLGLPIESPVVRERTNGGMQRWDPTYLWRDVEPDRIVEFLSGFNTHPSAIRVNTSLLREYIERQVERAELRRWTVTLFANGEGEDIMLAGLPAKKTKRSLNTRGNRTKELQKEQGIIRIRRLLSPRDPAIDLDANQYEAAVKQTKAIQQTGKREIYPSTRAIAAQRHKDTGLLMLFAIDPDLDDLDTASPLVGFSLSFPQSDNAPRVSYSVNNVYWTLEVEGE